ncbi:MAG TPA: Ig-like domain-containing protein [Streptosporangiaceae bacterium]|nr:Ig-like domain-containing protein [Streptosporangiaceae bacterium]
MAAAAAVILAAAGVYYYLQNPSPAQAAGNNGHAHQASALAKGPEQVVSVSPADGTKDINGAADVRVVFSETLSPTSPMPALSPAIKGTWRRSGKTAVFVPARGFSPRTKVTLRIPGGSTGIQSNGGGLLAAPVTVRFRTGTFSRIRMEQLLAQLGYLPLSWSPATGSAAPLSDPNVQLSAAYSPPQGSYTWQTGYPIQLKRLWKPNRPSEVLLGAVTAFESDHGLALDGTISRGVWRAMFHALTHDQMNKHGYTYALASQKLPETLTVWHNGAIVFKHLANTGIAIRPTAVHTDPVYLRYRFQIMKGTNPDGSKYADPVAWVAYFHYGEAVHYFPRYSYGSPQSLGCVELPYAPAKKVWPYLTFGTLVTVTAP